MNNKKTLPGVSMLGHDSVTKAYKVWNIQHMIFLGLKLLAISSLPKCCVRICNEV